MLETPQISRFQHENVFASAFRNETIKVNDEYLILLLLFLFKKPQ
jgi:hypothetical protein